MSESKRNSRASWWAWKKSVRKLAWNSTFKKLRSQHLVPSLHGKYMGKQWKQWQILFSWPPKSLHTLTAAMKLKDTCSLEGKLTNLDSNFKSRNITLLTKVYIFKAMVFPTHVQMWELDHNQGCCYLVAHRVRLFATTWTTACQASLSMGFSRQETGVGCHFLLQGFLMTQEWNPCLLHWQVISFTNESSWNEGWAPKNWCFQTVVLEKTVETLGQQDFFSRWREW